MDTRNKVNEIYNDGMYEFLNNNYEKSIEILSEAAAIDPDRKLTLVSRGAAYLRLNRLEEAMADFNKAIEIDPDYTRAFHLRGLVKERLEDDSGAFEDLNRAIKIDPEYGAAYHSRGTLYAKLGYEELAVEDIAMVQHLSNKNIENFANENNVWRSQQLRLESMMEG